MFYQPFSLKSMCRYSDSAGGGARGNQRDQEQPARRHGARRVDRRSDRSTPEIVSAEKHLKTHNFTEH